MNDVGVNARAEEGSSTTRAQAAGTEECRINAGEVANVASSGTQGCGYMVLRNVFTGPGWCEICMNGSGGRRMVVQEALAEADEGFAGAEKGISGSGVANLFTPDSILLISEGEDSSCDKGHRHVIQRGVRGKNNAVTKGKCDVAEAEGLGPPGASGVKVFSWSEEPVEANDTEVADVHVHWGGWGGASVKGEGKLS